MSDGPADRVAYGRGLAMAGAAGATLAAFLVLPEAITGWRFRAQDSVAAAALVFVVTVLVMRALVCRRAALLACAAVILVGGAGFDSTVGFDGWVRLEPGQAVKNLEEGREGLRPLGFELTLETLEPAGGARCVARTDSGYERFTIPRTGASVLGVRFGGPRLEHTGRALSLVVRLRSGQHEQSLSLRPGHVALADGLEIVLDEYHADFVLVGGVPRSRSTEPRNPAAVLSIRRGREVFRAFVLRAAPDLHQVEGLGASLALLAVEPERIVAIPVGRHPGVAIAGLGCALLIVGALVQANRP